MGGRKNLTAAVTVCALTVGLCSVAPGRIICVDDDAAGANDGSCWTDAFNYLQHALENAEAGDEVRVAQGIYKPDQGLPVQPPSRRRSISVAQANSYASFQLKNGVAIQGGFAGIGADDPDARDVQQYQTILSGDLKGNDEDRWGPWHPISGFLRSDNCYNIVITSGTDSSAVLDGFVVTAARQGGMNNHYGSPTAANCIFEENSAGTGGGVHNYKSNSTFTNCDFIRNASWWRCGSGMYNFGSDPTLRYCRFLENYTYTDGTYDGDGAGAGLLNWESSPLLINCVFAGNRADGRGGAIANSGNYVSGPTLVNCLLSDNSAENGGAMYNEGPHTSRSLKLINCTITGNFARDWCGGIYNNPSEYHENSSALTNCILWGNRDGDTDSQGQSEQIDGATPVIDNCCVEGWIGDLGGIGNFDANPYFAAPGLWIEGYWNDNDTPDDDEDDFWIDPSRVPGRYYLKSQAGRWDPNSQSWVIDAVTSPCIDAGDPMSPIGHEPFPNGGMINIGAYGGTAEASKSYFGRPVCETIVAGDINGDCMIDFRDFAFIGLHWLERNITDDD